MLITVAEFKGGVGKTTSAVHHISQGAFWFQQISDRVSND